MATTYDVTTDRGRVRLLITDTDTTAATFDDDEIDAFLTLTQRNSANVVFLAAAMALRAIAASEVLVQKRIRLLDLSTDGPAEARALRDLAGDYEAREEAMADFDIAELGYDPFSRRERIWNEALRGN
jgi:hypothetical protein